LTITSYSNIKRLIDEINARSAVDRVMALIRGRPFRTGNDFEAQRHPLARLRPE
jgi:hypothetical protein